MVLCLWDLSLEDDEVGLVALDAAHSPSASCIPVVLGLRAHGVPSYAVRAKQESLVQLSEV